MTTVRHTLGAITLAATAWVSHPGTAAASEIGKEVINVATVSYTVGELTTSVMTNQAVFTIESPIPDPTIEFFRHSPNAPNPRRVDIYGSDFSPTGSLGGPFTPIGDPRTAGGRIVDLSGPVPLIPATTYLTGELMFVQVTDIASNDNPAEIDTVTITITTDSGDVVVIQLYESGPNTGEFWAYIPTTNRQTSEHDNELTTADGTQLTGRYVDTFRETNIVVDTALINSNCFVFDSITGAPIDGATVTLVNADTGQPAAVYGVDNFSTFPSAVTSGTDVLDTSGLVYDPEDGGFQFPYIEPGRYYVTVDAPEGYSFSSVIPSDQIATQDGRYALADGSFGREFVLTEAGPIHFDIPLDPQTDFVLTKSADRNYADVGDFVNYTLTVQNSGARAAPVNLLDTLPLGFRYIPGTSRREKIASDDPQVADDAGLLTFPMGILAPGEIVTLDYALEIGPGAPMGDAINRAVVSGPSGDPLSNVARAAVKLREDLMRSRSTLVGRISEQSCDGDQDWARDIERGIGVEGVRLYMETGAYAVSDADGLFHFEGLREGTHVVQVDEETLPKGFTPMICEENTRYAGSATSKFVDIQGGGIWRANFYLKQTSETADAVIEDDYNDTLAYKGFDATWLNQQDSTPEWVYPDTTRTPSSPSINIGIKHTPQQRVDITLNDKPVSAMNLAARDLSRSQLVMISRWRGVDLLEGNNTITAVVKNQDGTVAKVLSKNIAFVRNIARAVAVPDKSTLIANGRDVPMVAIRLEDEAGRAVHKGRIARVDVETPYRLYDETGERELRERQDDVLAALSARQDIQVGADGILKVRLEPTLRTGKVTVIVTLDNGRKVPIYMYLEPEKRDWIMVGLAEGSAALENIKGKVIAAGSDADKDDVITDGRVAFFAKGLIKGNWLMTMAVDTDTRRFDDEQGFEGEIDPNAYYTLYGDRSYQEFEGVSRYPVFVKLEKRTAYAMFGDFDTDIPEGRLTSYNRRLSGLKAEYIGETIQVLGFAAETNQGFAKDEIAADGTSGTYQLSNQRILAQSEEIIIETRDRNRPDVVLDRKVMVRYLDYTLDYLTGQLIFRLPVDASDFDFNPNVIVADYETLEDAEKNITAGGRVQAQLMDGRVQVGSTFVHEEGATNQAGSKQDMIGVDVVVDVTENTEVRAEYAITEDQSTPSTGTATAMLAEVIHTSERLSAEAYFREEDEGFGLGQRNSNTNRIRRYGATAALKISEFEDADTGRRGTRAVEGRAYREENLVTGDTRDAGEVSVRHTGDRITASAGLRAAKDTLVGRDDRQSLLATSRVSLNVPKHGATFQLAHEEPLGGKDAVSAFPRRTSIGVDKTLGERATASIRHEILDGATQQSANTTFGLTTTPFKGTTISANSDLTTNDLGRRLGATIGVDQQVQLSERWSASAGLRNRKVLDQSGEYVEVAPDAAISPLEVNEDFTSGYMGVGYRDDVMNATARVEARNSSAGDTWIGTAGVARELSEELSVAGALRGFFNERTGEPNASARIEGRVGAAWRPRGEDTIYFNRLDVTHEKDEQGEVETKIVNNFAMNTMVADNWQLSTNYGVKYARADIAGEKHTSWNHLLGAETRFDVTEKIDIGLRGQFMHSSSLDNTSYSWGPSIGVAPVKNVWVSAGYNVQGFKDDDFEASEYSRKGVYLQMRIKFDQNTARGLLRRISPSAVVSETPSSGSFANP